MQILKLTYNYYFDYKYHIDKKNKKIMFILDLMFPKVIYEIVNKTKTKYLNINNKSLNKGLVLNHRNKNQDELFKKITKSNLGYIRMKIFYTFDMKYEAEITNTWTAADKITIYNVKQETKIYPSLDLKSVYQFLNLMINYSLDKNINNIKNNGIQNLELEKYKEYNKNNTLRKFMDNLVDTFVYNGYLQTVLSVIQHGYIYD